MTTAMTITDSQISTLRGSIRPSSPTALQAGAQITFTKFDGSPARGDRAESQIVREGVQVGAVFAEVKTVWSGMSRAYRVDAYRVEIWDGECNTIAAREFPVADGAAAALSAAKRWAREMDASRG